MGGLFLIQFFISGATEVILFLIGRAYKISGKAYLKIAPAVEADVAYQAIVNDRFVVDK